jgi:hypothetical protein
MKLGLNHHTWVQNLAKRRQLCKKTFSKEKYSTTLENTIAYCNTRIVVVNAVIEGLSPEGNVMINVFGDFPQFSAKKWLFHETQCYDPNFAITRGSLYQKCQFFGEIIF